MDNFTPRLLYSQEKIPWYPLDRRMGGPNTPKKTQEQNDESTEKFSK
jgi:hypothetical protein